MVERNLEMINTYLAAVNNRIDAPQFSPFVPKPTEKDYELGEIQRYFAQQVNNDESEIFEISKQEFGAANLSPLYLAISVRWRISGPADSSRRVVNGEVIRERTGIVEANTTAVKQAAKKMPAIAQKLANPYQLWRGY